MSHLNMEMRTEPKHTQICRLEAVILFLFCSNIKIRPFLTTVHRKENRYKDTLTSDYVDTVEMRPRRSLWFIIQIYRSHSRINTDTQTHPKAIWICG